MGEGKLRCPECFHFTPAFWLNLFSLLLLVTLVVTNFLYLWKMVPIVATFAAGMGFDLPLPMRLYIRVSNLSATIAFLALAVAIPVILLLKGRKVRVPSFVTSGKLLAVVTWVALLFSLVGIITGYVDVLRKMPRLIR
jgi:hypothetical protein